MPTKQFDNYTKNICSLITSQPELVQKLNGFEIDDKVRFIKGKDTGNILVNKQPYLPNRLIRDEIINTVTLSEKKLLLFGVLLGSSLGYMIQESFIRYSESIRVLCVVEKDLKVLKAIFHIHDFSQLIDQKRIYFFTDIPSEQFYSFFYEMLCSEEWMVYSPVMEFFYNPFSNIEEKTYYSTVCKIIVQAFRNRVLTLGTDPGDAQEGLKNILDNFNIIEKEPNLMEIGPIFLNKPAVIVAAGPSLNQEIENLKKIQDKVLIVSCDTAFLILKSNGITPHIVTSLERIQAASDLFSWVSEEDSENVILSAVPLVKPETYQYFKGKSISVFKQGDMFDWLEMNVSGIPTGSSSANLAFQNAKFLGCNPIILVGQDLCFGRDGKTHAQGAFYGDNQEIIKTYSSDRVLNNQGQWVDTQLFWQLFLKQYEQMLIGWKGTCINTSRNGAKISGTCYRDFGEWISQQKFEKIEYRSILLNRYSQLKRERPVYSFEKLVFNTEKYIEHKITSWSEFRNLVKHFLDGNSLLDSSVSLESVYLNCQKCLNSFAEENRYSRFVLAMLKGIFIHYNMKVMKLNSIQYSSESERKKVILRQYFLPLIEKGIEFFEISLNLLQRKTEISDEYRL